MFGNGYVKVNRSDDQSRHGEASVNPMIELSGGSSSSQPATGNTFSVKILCKEKSYEITGVHGETQISEIKRRAEALTEIPSQRQRLIMTGKLLKPDDKTLSFFKIGANASIHLFPIPEATAAPVPVAAPGTVPVVTDARAVGGNNQYYNVLNPLGQQPQNAISAVPMHPGTLQAVYDVSLEQTIREVKLWCFILLSLSAIELFNNFSILSATGKLGENPVDVVFFILDTCCSVGGIYVANMGMKSVRTLDVGDIRQYVQWLGILAMGCVLLRVIWVADIILRVQHEVKLANEHQNTGGDNNGSSTTTDDLTNGNNNNNNQPHYDNQTVVAIGVQAAMIAVIIIGAWLSCFRRALRLHLAVALRPNNSVPATATTDAQVAVVPQV